MNHKFSGKRLRRIRERQKMTQADLARAVGLEPDVISDYERGTFTPGETMLNKFTVVLKCEIADLVD